MSENVKLPRDVAEYQRTLREVFRVGAWWQAMQREDPTCYSPSEASAEADRRFPITRTVSREPVKLPGNAGTVAPVDGKYVSFLPASYVEGSGAYFDAADLDAMRDLLDNPTRTITE